MQTAVITGASSGIGREVAVALGRQGFHIIAMSRSRSRAEDALQSIRESGGSVEWIELDLASLESVRRAAAEIEAGGHSVDVLVNNAGVGMTKGQTGDGFEVNFGVNHLGHFLLTRLLEGAFHAGSRIVNVTSAMHFRADGIDFDALEQPSRSFLGIHDYSVSKLANLLFTKALARHAPDLRAYAVHPGMIDTGIFRWWVKPFIKSRLRSPEVGARTIVLCATDPSLGDATGGYYSLMSETTPSKTAQDQSLAEELWSRSEDWCGLTQAT